MGPFSILLCIYGDFKAPPSLISAGLSKFLTRWKIELLVVLPEIELVIELFLFNEISASKSSYTSLYLWLPLSICASVPDIIYKTAYSSCIPQANQ
jgi:hypothetical protein